jgi:hypothetical protein
MAYQTCKVIMAVPHYPDQFSCVWSVYDGDQYLELMSTPSLITFCSMRPYVCFVWNNDALKHLKRYGTRYKCSRANFMGEFTMHEIEGCAFTNFGHLQSGSMKNLSFEQRCHILWEMLELNVFVNQGENDQIYH